MQKSSPRSQRKQLKTVLFLLLGGVIFAGLFWYVNTYIYKNRAAFPQANMTLTANPTSIDISGTNSKDIDVAFTLSGQKISAAELYITYDASKVGYIKELDGVSGFSEVKATGAANYFNDPLIEEITDVAGTTNKQIRLVLVSTYTDPNNAAWTTNVVGNLKFRAKAAGTTTIEVVKTGTKPSQLAGVGSTGEATYFDLPANAISATITISGIAPTESITPTVGAGTITPTRIPTGSTTTPTVTPSKTQTPSPTRTPTPKGPTLSPTSTSKIVTLNMKVKFQGITDKPKDANSMQVKVALASNTNSYNNIQTVTFTPEANGIWSGKADFSNVPLQEKFSVFVKGPKHLRKRICVTSPRETIPGGYKCTEGNQAVPLGAMTVTTGNNNMDFSNVVLLAGDIPVQNGVVDAVDFTYIRANFGSTDDVMKSRGDLNYDGIIDTQDYSLVLAALAFKYDEE